MTLREVCVMLRLIDPPRAFRCLEYRQDGWTVGRLKGAVAAPARRAAGAGREASNSPAEARATVEAGRKVAVCPQVAETLLRAVADWRRAGIEVYGFRPPSSPEMVLWEDRYYQYDESAFQAKFEAAGGTWLHFDQAGYGSYDGSHLHHTEAVRLSQELAGRIRAANVMQMASRRD